MLYKVMEVSLRGAGVPGTWEAVLRFMWLMYSVIMVRAQEVGALIEK